jgi:hypothetical protein
MSRAVEVLAEASDIRAAVQTLLMNARLGTQNGFPRFSVGRQMGREQHHA